MEYKPGSVSKRTKILFPIIVTIIVGPAAPSSASLVGFLMFGNLIRECGVLQNLSETAQGPLTNLITLLLGITISFSMTAAGISAFPMASRVVQKMAQEKNRQYSDYAGGMIIQLVTSFM